MWSQAAWLPHPQDLFAFCVIFFCLFAICQDELLSAENEKVKEHFSIILKCVYRAGRRANHPSEFTPFFSVRRFVRAKAQTHTHTHTHMHAHTHSLTLHAPPWVLVQSYKSYNGLPHLTVRRPGDAADSTPPPAPASAPAADADTFAVRRRAFEYKINIQYMPMWVCILFLAYIISGIEK